MADNIKYLKKLENNLVDNLNKNIEDIKFIQNKMKKADSKLHELDNSIKKMYDELKELYRDKKIFQHMKICNENNIINILNTWVNIDENFSPEKSKLLKDNICSICHEVGVLPVIPLFDCKCDYNKFIVCINCVRTQCKLNLNQMNDYREVKCFLCSSKKYFMKSDSGCFTQNLTNIRKIDSIFQN